MSNKAKSFPFVQQLDIMDCGPACLAMISRYFGKFYSLQTLRKQSFINKQGVSLLGISDAAESIGMRSLGARLTFEQLKEEVPLPCIVHWRQNHFIVVYRIEKNKVFVADPAHGLLSYSIEEFLMHWVSTQNDQQRQGIALILEPTPNFYQQPDEPINKTSLRFLFSYIRPYRFFLIQLFIGILFGSLLQLLFPFLTQSMVDRGINTQNLGFVYLILIAQLVLFFSETSVELIRSWIILHISTRVNVSLISDFLSKLMKLPIGFFDSKRIGDILQRIGDHYRIESFLTNSTLSILFSMFNLLVFGIILAFYSGYIFLIFLIATILYVLWVLVFMKKRRELDYKRFNQLAQNQSNLIQLITGIQEIKLNNCEKQKRWDWERIQAKLFHVNVKNLSLSQYQMSGSMFIHEFKNILISFLAAKSVIDGQITLGMMMAVQYIIGQLNAPIQQLIQFFHSFQDAKISLERLGEIQKEKDEETLEEHRIYSLPLDRTIAVQNLSFQYEGPHSESVIKDISLSIPQQKVTAIVGQSGSGKTTLIKLLLGFYKPSQGEIRVGDISLNNVSPRMWRQSCGVVMQDGFIFSDSISRNITVGEETINHDRLIHAIRMANIEEFIESLPLGLNTQIGMEGHGLSQGQRQRILIARSIYKDPQYIFFDEATNALDAQNEKVIISNLNRFFQGRTVVIVAHRLSTVRHADQIIVLAKGTIVELGTHDELIQKKGNYFHLVKDQLELGA